MSYSYLALVKNRTSHGSPGSQQTTHACDTSLETAMKMPAFDTVRNAILQQTEKLSTFEVYTFVNIYIMVHLLCAEV